jgi:hypothetical protein
LIEEIPHQIYIGDTALHVAAAAFKPDVVEGLLGAGAELLLQHGADLGAKDAKGARPPLGTKRPRS